MLRDFNPIKIEIFISVIHRNILKSNLYITSLFLDSFEKKTRKWQTSENLPTSDADLSKMLNVSVQENTEIIDM